MTPPKGARAVLYLRVSTDGQGESGLGLEAQRTRLQSYAASQNLTVTGEHVDVQSGRTLDRPALQQAIESLQQGDVLLAVKLDRLTRTARDLDTLTEAVHKRGAAWATVEGHYDTSSATGRFLVRVIADIAQMEREVTAERTVAALQAKKERRERLGTTPYGYNPDGSINQAEAHIVLQVRAARRDGQPLQTIADMLNSQGVAPRRGRQWYASTVSRICQTRYLETIA